MYTSQSLFLDILEIQNIPTFWYLTLKKNFSSFFKHFFKCVVIAVMIMKTVVVLTLAFVACFMLQPVGSVVSSIFCMKQLRQH